MALRLPEKQLSNDAIQRRVPRDNSQMIMQAMGNNPYARAIDQITPVIANALQMRAQLRQQAQDAAAVSKALETGVISPDIRDPNVMLNIYEAQTARSKIRPEQQERTVFVSDYKKNPQPYDEFQAAGGKLNFINDLSGENRDKNYQARIGKDIRQWAQNMTTNPAIKPLVTQGINSGIVKRLSEEARAGNTLAFSAMGPKIAKAMGEVGVLTDKDIKIYKESGKLSQQAADKLLTLTTGRPTDATLDEINQIMDVLSDRFSTQVQPMFNWYAGRLAATTDMDLDASAKALGITYDYGIDESPFPFGDIKKGGAGKEEQGTFKIKSVTQVGGR